MFYVHFLIEMPKRVKYLIWISIAKVENGWSWIGKVELVRSWKSNKLILWKVENSKVEVVISWKCKSWKAQVENVKLKLQKLNHQYHAPGKIPMFNEIQIRKNWGVFELTWHSPILYLNWEYGYGTSDIIMSSSNARAYFWVHVISHYKFCSNLIS